MRSLQIDEYVIETPLETILTELRLMLANGKLKDIEARGDNLVVTCPHHDGGHESKPACSVYIGEDDSIAYGAVNCFACGFKGPFWRLVAEAIGCSDDRAKDWLKKRYGKQVASSIKLAPAMVMPTRRKAKKQHRIDDSILSEYQSYCPYLAKRNLTRETCERFNVKYDSKYRQVVFPCYDEKGNLIMLPKRSIDTKSFYLDKEQEKPLYCLDKVKASGASAVIITEGPFDTLLANQYGFPAIGTLGRISDEQIAKLNDSGISTIYAMFDNDAAGRSFNAELHKKLNKRIMIVDVHIPSPYKDIGELDYDTFWRTIEEARAKQL